MSYCRWSEGDVYLIAHCDGYFACYNCEPTRVGTRPSEALRHLREAHSKDSVPRRAFDRLQEEIDGGDKSLAGGVKGGGKGCG